MCSRVFAGLDDFSLLCISELVVVVVIQELVLLLLEFYCDSEDVLFVLFIFLNVCVLRNGFEWSDTCSC